MHPTRYAKAIVAFLAPVLAGLAANLQSGLTSTEITRQVIIGLLTALVVWSTPNSQPAAPGPFTTEIE